MPKGSGDMFLLFEYSSTFVYSTSKKNTTSKQKQSQG